MTPFLQALTDEQRHFNKMHAKARSKVERCIGVLKNRFRCLLGERILLYSHERSSKIIASCVILHNFLRHFNYDNDENDIIINDIHNDADDRNVHVHDGRAVRDRLAQQLYNNRRQ